ncbi:MAG: hypothetical protein KDA22_09665 [Phycisphaerales bacterium]|nr:hypothetical protein [Phycisphaerales bacterium]
MLRTRQLTSVVTLFACVTAASAWSPARAQDSTPAKPVPKQPAPPATAPDAPAAAPAAEDLPAVADILAKYIKAIGGEEALRSRSSRTIEAEFSIPSMSMSGNMTIRNKAPDLLVMSMNVPGLGDVRTGYDGKIAWAEDPAMGPMVIEGAQLEQMKRDADFYKELNFQKHYPTMKTTGTEELEGKNCYAVTMSDAGGSETVALFDMASGLLVGMKADAATPMGDMPTVTYLRDYTDYDGVLLPQVTETAMASMKQVIKVKSVSWDALETDAFKLPPQIKALTEKTGDEQIPPLAPATPAAPGGTGSPKGK